MTPADIERMARECIAEDWSDHIPGYYRDMNITRFARLVAAHERERCAKVCERTYPEWRDGEIVLLQDFESGEDCAAAIRAL